MTAPKISVTSTPPTLGKLTLKYFSALSMAYAAYSAVVCIFTL